MIKLIRKKKITKQIKKILKEDKFARKNIVYLILLMCEKYYKENTYEMFRKIYNNEDCIKLKEIEEIQKTSF